MELVKYIKAWEERVTENTAHCKIDGKHLKKETLHKCYDENLKEVDLKNKTILDYGCGGGLVRKYIGTKKINKYIGLDIAKRSIKYATKNLKSFDDIELNLINPYKIDLKKYEADMFICFSVIQHFPDKEYFNMFFYNLNLSGIKEICLQIKWNNKLEFKPDPYRTTGDINNACMCSVKDIEKALPSYEIVKESGSKNHGDYYHINMRLKSV